MFISEELQKEKEKLELRYSRFCKDTSLLYEVSGSWRFYLYHVRPHFWTIGERSSWWYCRKAFCIEFGNIRKYRNSLQAFSDKFQHISKKEFEKVLASIHSAIEKIQIEKEAKLISKCNK